MWRYEKRLQYPVKISQTNPKMASFIISQYGGLYCKNLQYFLELNVIYKMQFAMCLIDDHFF